MPTHLLQLSSTPQVLNVHSNWRGQHIYFHLPKGLGRYWPTAKNQVYEMSTVLDKTNYQCAQSFGEILPYIKEIFSQENGLQEYSSPLMTESNKS